MKDEEGGAGNGEDIFSWMFMNPDLFPARQAVSSPTPSPALDEDEDGLFLEDDNFPADFQPTVNNISSPSPAPAPPAPTTTTVSIAVRTLSDHEDEDEGDEGDEEEEEEEGEPSGSKPEDKASREKRLEKNREIARNCRKRKREKQQSLEDEVNKLKEWNSQLEAKLLQIHPETLSRETIRKQEVDVIFQLVQNDCSEEEIKERLDLHKEVYAGFGKERKQAISYHLEQLKILLLPNQVSKMTLFALQQEDEFYNEERNKTTFGGGIWNLLCEELGLTSEQKNTLLNMRKEIRNQRMSVSKCLSILRDLEASIRENLGSSVVQLAKVQKVTTPSQQAKFLWWIENNQSQIQILNNMWEQRK
ncbi:hypothetical protein BASA81_008373 [Batrachochytrium salamandrivorans]|nr:hypothetical protein BASA81_008373 [Batrachochytrium salamandrivorans]